MNTTNSNFARRGFASFRLRRKFARLGLILLACCPLFVSMQRAEAARGDLVKTFSLAANRLAVDPIRPRIYATLTGSNSVAVIDTSTLSVIKTIPIGSNPVGLAVSPDASKLYVANSGSTTSAIGVIDLETLQTLPSLWAPAGPSDIAAGLNGRLYLTPALQNGGIMQIDSTTGALQAEFDGDRQVFVYAGGFLAMSPDRKTLYFGNAGISAATLASFDVSAATAALLQVNSSTVGSNGKDLQISHSGSFLGFAVGGGQGNYSIAEIPANNLAGSNGLLNTGAYPTNIAFSPDDAVAYAAPDSQKTVKVFDTANFLMT